MDFLEKGVLRFKRDGFRRNRALFRKLAKSQSPRVLFITCADSRVVPALITQTRPGDLFVERNPGNIVPVYSRHPVGVSASIEYAISVLNVEHVVVCGHTDCGAVKGIQHPEKLSSVPAVKRWLTYGNNSRRLLGRAAGLSEPERLGRLTELNVVVQLGHLMSHPSVARAIRRRRIALHGWVYRIHDGEILQLDPRTGAFRPWPR
jgi:carbonic anhydrase